MSELVLVRDSYGPNETMGRMQIGTQTFHTIERPWVPGPDDGGMPFESCVPDGTYGLVPHTRPNGDMVVALVAEELGVWYRKEDRPEVWGRYLVLIHAGNYVTDIVGCVAPGLARTIHQNRQMVTSSRAAIQRMDIQGFTSLVIKPTSGAKDGT